MTEQTASTVSSKDSPLSTGFVFMLIPLAVLAFTAYSTSPLLRELASLVESCQATASCSVATKIGDPALFRSNAAFLTVVAWLAFIAFIVDMVAMATIGLLHDASQRSAAAATTSDTTTESEIPQ